MLPGSPSSTRTTRSSGVVTSEADNASPVEWRHWHPTEEATLLFVIPGDGRVLLIHKKRGLGNGLINAPGGRMEIGETPVEAAVRETREELRIEVRSPCFGGNLKFHFLDGYRLEVHVFRCADYEGVPSETEEATPEWFPVDAIPYGSMWADDPHWLPLLLQGTPFAGRFVFDGRRLLWHHVESPGASSPV